MPGVIGFSEAAYEGGERSLEKVVTVWG